MAIYSVSYDLHSPGQNYEDLIKKLKTFNGYRKVQQSVWLIQSSETAASVRDVLKGVLDENDKLLVVKLCGWATLNDADTAAWIKKTS